MPFCVLCLWPYKQYWKLLELDHLIRRTGQIFRNLSHWTSTLCLNMQQWKFQHHALHWSTRIKMCLWNTVAQSESSTVKVKFTRWSVPTSSEGLSPTLMTDGPKTVCHSVWQAGKFNIVSLSSLCIPATPASMIFLPAACLLKLPHSDYPGHYPKSNLACNRLREVVPSCDRLKMT